MQINIKEKLVIVTVNSPKYGLKQVLVDIEDFNRIKNLTKRAWTYDKSGYVKVRLDENVRKFIHQLVMQPPVGFSIDHINCNKLDNRKINLRLCTNAENQQNRISAPITNKSTGILGVTLPKGRSRFRAVIKTDDKLLFSMQYSTLEEATSGIKEARARLLPFSQEALNKVTTIQRMEV